MRQTSSAAVAESSDFDGGGNSPDGATLHSTVHNVREARVSDHSRAVTAAILGAVGGAVAAYLLFTDRGRALRRDLESVVDGTAAELNSLRSAVQKTAGLASDGWKLLTDALGESADRRVDGARQPDRF
jgi:hypothetical protein